MNFTGEVCARMLDDSIYLLYAVRGLVYLCLILYVRLYCVCLRANISCMNEKLDEWCI